MTRVVLIVILVCGLRAKAQTIQFSVVPQEIVEQRLAAYVTKNTAREPAVRRLFEDAGCSAENLIEQPVKGLKASNPICSLGGTGESVIVVGAHFDLVESGDGVVDNWSGASLLPSLYQGLAGVVRRHTFRFISFSGEESGLVGSRAYVQQLTKNHEAVAAMVNLDTLGLADSEVWVSHADPQLLRLMEVASKTVKLPFRGMNVERVGSTDSEPFREKKIPAITVHSLTQETLAVLHSSKDRIEAIHKDEYYQTYRLVLAYLALLDQSLN